MFNIQDNRDQKTIAAGLGWVIIDGEGDKYIVVETNSFEYGLLWLEDMRVICKAASIEGSLEKLRDNHGIAGVCNFQGGRVRDL